jgi:hypothetical protein
MKRYKRKFDEAYPETEILNLVIKALKRNLKNLKKDNVVITGYGNAYRYIGYDLSYPEIEIFFEGDHLKKAEEIVVLLRSNNYIPYYFKYIKSSIDILDIDNTKAEGTVLIFKLMI